MMTKDEIKKALECCCNSDFKTCRNCSYLGSPRCNDTLCKDALNLISEQEKEIKRLKAENKKYLDSIESVQAGRCCLICPLTEQAVKQAKIDVLNELRERVETAIDTYFNKDGGGYYLAECAINDIDEMIEELKNEHTKT